MRAGRAEGVRLFTSAPLIAELRKVLLRPKFEKQITASLFSVDQLVHFYTELAPLVRPTSLPHTAPDPDDDAAIGTALSAKAHFLVSGDGPLLSVGRYEGGRIVSVSEALRAVVSFLKFGEGEMSEVGGTG